MRVVLDTNVLVSGLLHPDRSSGQVLRMPGSGLVTPLFDARILKEYRDVLTRPEFGFFETRVSELLEGLEREGEPVSAPPLAGRFPDPDDVKFIEVAVAGHAEAIVTGNARHFPVAMAGDVRILPPDKFLAYFANSQPTR